MQCEVTSGIICINNKVEYLDKKTQLQKFYQRSYLVILSDLCNENKKNNGQNCMSWAL